MKPAFKLLYFLILLATCVQAEVHVEITHDVNNAEAIAIVPFKWSGIGIPPNRIDQIIAADLRNSGKFKPIDLSCMPQQPATASEVISDIWESLGIKAIVVGQVQPAANGQYIVNYQLVDVLNSSGCILIQNQLKVNSKWLRYAAHTISDEIFIKLTGIRGAFCTRIAYVVKTNDEKLPYELRVSDYDGYNQFTIYRSPEPLMSPAWSANGEKLIYVTFESGSSRLVMQTLATAEIRQITSFPKHNGAPTFSPDGTKLAFVLSKSGSLNLYIMDLNNEEICQVTSGPSNNTEPSWMPDSQTLIYTSDQAGCPQIYKLNINDNIPERITWKEKQNQDARVSPDGKFIVMVNSSDCKQRIVKQDLTTGDIEYLTDSFLDETPSIAPNGTMVIYSSSQGLGSVIRLVSINGQFKGSLLIADREVKFPAWSPYL